LFSLALTKIKTAEIQNFTKESLAFTIIPFFMKRANI